MGLDWLVVCFVCSTFGQFTDDSLVCKRCPAGAICNSTGIYGDGNYYVYYNSGTGEVVAQECLPGYCVTCRTSSALPSLSHCSALLCSAVLCVCVCVAPNAQLCCML